MFDIRRSVAVRVVSCVVNYRLWQAGVPKVGVDRMCRMNKDNSFAFIPIILDRANFRMAQVVIVIAVSGKHGDLVRFEHIQ